MAGPRGRRAEPGRSAQPQQPRHGLGSGPDDGVLLEVAAKLAGELLSDAEHQHAGFAGPPTLGIGAEARPMTEVAGVESLNQVGVPGIVLCVEQQPAAGVAGGQKGTAADAGLLMRGSGLDWSMRSVKAAGPRTWYSALR